MFPLFGVLLVSLSVMGLDQSDSYGPYTASWDAFDTCKGPKRKECGLFQIVSKTNLSEVVFVIDLPKDCLINRARITTTIKRNNLTRILFNYGLGNPCQHFVFGPIMKEALNMTTNCSVKKGYYKIVLNLYEKIQGFLGPSFYYGSYIYKMVVHNDQKNFFCILSAFNAKKKV